MPITDPNGVIYASGQPFYDYGLTNFFRTVMPDAKNNASVLIGMIDKGTKEAVSGRYIIWPVKYGRSTGLGNVNWGGKIPDPGVQNIRDYVTFTRKGMCRIKLDGDTLRHGKTNGGAFVGPMAIEVEGIMDDVMIDRARQVHNDGSGRLGQVVSTSSATVTTKGNIDIEGAATTKWSGTLEAFFEPGMRVSFASPAGAIRTVYTASGNQTAAFVSSVVASANNVDVAFAITQARALAGLTDAFASAPVANEWIFRSSPDTTVATLSDSAWRRELTGIGGIFQDVGILDGVGAAAAQQSTSTATTDDTNITIANANFQGLPVSLPFNKAVVIDNSGSGNLLLTEERMQLALSDAERLNNANVTVLMSSFPTYDSYVKTLTPDKRYNDTLDLKGGHKTLSFNGIPWIKDRFCYQNRVYFLALDQIHMIETQAVTDLAIEDVTTWKQVIGTGGDVDAWWRGWVWEDQIVTDVRQRCGAVLTEIAA